METAHVKHIGLLNELPHVSALQVVEVIGVCGSKVCAQATVMASDDGGAAARREGVIDAILDAQVSVGNGTAQCVGVAVVADAAKVDDAVGREEVLCAAGGVLCGAAGNELGGVVGEEVVEDG